jgi:hypothetical protein
MAYPDRSDFTSGNGGAAWWLNTRPRGAEHPDVAASQWDTLVRRFQQRARDGLGTASGAALIYAPVYLFGRDGRCDVSLSNLPDAVMANWRRRDALTTDGQWGPETADALGFLLCAAGMSDRARRLAQEIQARTLSIETVRDLIWFATSVQTVGTVGAPAVTADLEQQYLLVPPAALLPTWSTVVRSDPRDAEYLVSWNPETGAAPVPPSRAAAPAQPDPASVLAPVNAALRPWVIGGAIVLGTGAVVALGALAWRYRAHFTRRPGAAAKRATRGRRRVPRPNPWRAEE